MDASFQNKLNELEARYKAKSESKQLRENVPHEINLSGSPLPRRPKPFGDLSFTRPCSAFAIGVGFGASAAPEASPSRLEHNTTPTPVASPAPSTPLALVRKSSLTPQNQSRSIVSPNVRDMSLFSPTCRNQNCGSTGARFAAEAASPSRTLLDSKTSSPSSGGSSSGGGGGGGEWMWRGGSARTPSPVEHGLGTPRIGSFGNLGGIQLNGQPRRRHVLNLPCSPQTPKALDSVEIEHKYTEIMKQAGILTIDGQKVLTDISELQPLGELGHGTCGQVIKMVHTKSDLVMAVKQMRRSGNCEENKRIIMDLDVVVKSHNCPYIVQCIGTFITSADVWICMELMATCLDKLLKNLQEPVPERILGKVTVATVNALHYLKENHGVIHRDVKPSNILLDERGRIKLCDFGISGRLVDSKAKTRSAGCAAYMAPERIDPPDPSKPDYDIRADVWSLGLSLVELATGTFPYKNCKTDFEVLTKVLQDDPPLLPSGWRFSMDFCSFVGQCLTKDYHRRPKYPKLLEHNFIKRYATLNIDVAAWYAEASRKIELNRSTGVDQQSTEQLNADGDCAATLYNFISPLGLQ